MKRLTSFLGHGGAVLTIAVMVVSPFVLFAWFERGWAAWG